MIPTLVRVRSRALAALFLAVAALPFGASAQQPAALAKPDVALWTNGVVNVTARAPDGSVVIGGAFDRVAGVARGNLARIGADGTLDATWTASTNGTVNAIAIGANGDVFVGGFFSSAGGVNRSNVAKFSGSGAGAVDPTWNPNAAGGTVGVLVPDGAGFVYAGGSFTSIGGAARNRLAKLSAGGAGSSDGLWDPNVANGSVEAIALDPANGAVIVGGSFTSVGGQIRARVAKVSATGNGAVDLAWNPGADGQVASLVVDGGFLYAGGTFYGSFAGVPRSCLARVVAATGADDPTFAATFNNGVSSIAIDGDDVYVVGSFSVLNGSPRASPVARLAKSDGAVDPTFAPFVNISINHVAAYGDGFVWLASPQLTTVDDQVRLGVARLDTAGALAPPTDAMAPAAVYAIEPLADGSTIVGGNFYYAGDAVHATLLKLTPDGDVDPAWTPGTNGTVFGLEANPAGTVVYVSGTFARAGGAFRRNAAKFSVATGALDANWNLVGMLTDVAPQINDLTVAADGGVYVGGRFDQLGGGFRNNLAKVSGTDATLVAAWGPNGANQEVARVFLAPDGSVFASGFFSTINGSAKAGFAKLDAATGVTDPTWTANLGMFEFVGGVAFAGDAMYAAGSFTAINSQTRNGFAKLSVSSPMVLDATWAPTVSPTGGGTAIAIAPDGGLLVAGDFSFVQGQPRRRLAKIGADGMLDPEWSPLLDPASTGLILGDLALDAAGRVLVGGLYDLVNDTPRQGIAALPPDVPKPDPVFDDGFE